jgi:hypothetical protein
MHHPMNSPDRGKLQLFSRRHSDPHSFSLMRRIGGTLGTTVDRDGS